MSLWSRIQRQLGEIAGDLLPDETRLELEGARELLASDPAAVIPIAERVLEERPDHAIALALLGTAHLELGDARAAADVFDRALAMTPGLPEALLGRGQAALALGRPEDAITPYHRGIEEAGGNRRVLAEAYRGLGVAYRKMQRIDKAVRELRKAVAEEPDDPVARACLGEALIVRGGNQEARRHLRRAADAAEPTALAFFATSLLAREEEDWESAESNLLQALDALAAKPAGAFDVEPSRIHQGLGDCAWAQGRQGEAEEHYQRAVEAAAAVNPELLARMADLKAEEGDLVAALDRYRRSLEAEESIEVLERAVLVAIRGGTAAVRVELANRLLAHNPDNALAMVARARASLDQGDREAAHSILMSALEHDVHGHSQRALAQMELEEGNQTLAAEYALAALRLSPRDAEARELLARIRDAELEAQVGGLATDEDKSDPKHVTEAGDAALYQLAMELSGLLATRPELAALALEPANAAADFDRPLLVTVMGEFSSGKSSFVNAFIGEDIAPTGITPTTATINVVKYGRERGGRVIAQDGRTESLSWDELVERLRALTGRAAARIAQVEIMLPLEELERVHIVDTPGLNSILPEHETVARDFISRADAVVWVFSAAQAGKKSERLALERIRGEGKRVLGVLNKVDQLADQEIEAVKEHVAEKLGELVELVVPVSARRALEAKGGGGDGGGEFQRLERELEGRFFAHARDLKRAALDRRLGEILERARIRIDEAVKSDGGQTEALRQASEHVRTELAQFLSGTVDRERAAMREEVTALFKRASEEVLELVRPRRLPFGSHQATPADRDYLIGLLEAGYEELIARAEERVIGELDAIGVRARRALSKAGASASMDPTGDIDRSVADAARWVRAQVFRRTVAYVSGYLRGGYVSEFFRRDLPKLELDSETIYQALYKSSPDLDSVIAVPLARAGAEALDALAARLSHLADVAELHAFDLDVGIERALKRVQSRREALAKVDEDAEDHTGHR